MYTYTFIVRVNKIFFIEPLLKQFLKYAVNFVKTLLDLEASIYISINSTKLVKLI